MTLDDLRATVAVMRELGVVRFEGIELAAAPLPTSPARVRVTPEEAAKLAAARDRRVLFAASGVMPRDEAP